MMYEYESLPKSDDQSHLATRILKPLPHFLYLFIIYIYFLMGPNLANETQTNLIFSLALDRVFPAKMHLHLKPDQSN